MPVVKHFLKLLRVIRLESLKACEAFSSACCGAAAQEPCPMQRVAVQAKLFLQTHTNKNLPYLDKLLQKSSQARLQVIPVLTLCKCRSSVDQCR